MVAGNRATSSPRPVVMLKGPELASIFHDGPVWGWSALASMIHRGVLWCDLRLVEPQDGWILAVGVLIRPGCPGGCRFHCGGLLVLSVGRWFGGYWGQPGWRDQMRVQALTRSSAQAQSSGSFKIW